MAFLTIAGTDYDVSTQGAARQQGDAVGETSRSFDGTLRSSVRAVKRAWQFTLAPMTMAAFAAFDALYRVPAVASVTGVAVPGPLSCEVSISGVAYVDGGAVAYAAPSILVREV